jgi:hypothetical protein
MFQMVAKVIKWVSIPVLLTASILSRFIASYELPVDLFVCLGAIFFVLRAARLHEYFWAAGFILIAVVFSPLWLIAKVFLLIGLTCMATFITVLEAFRKTETL